MTHTLATIIRRRKSPGNIFDDCVGKTNTLLFAQTSSFTIFNKNTIFINHLSTLSIGHKSGPYLVYRTVKVRLWYRFTAHFLRQMTHKHVTVMKQNTHTHTPGYIFDSMDFQGKLTGFILRQLQLVNSIKNSLFINCVSSNNFSIRDH